MVIELASWVKLPRRPANPSCPVAERSLYLAPALQEILDTLALAVYNKNKEPHVKQCGPLDRQGAGADEQPEHFLANGFNGPELHLWTDAGPGMPNLFRAGS